MYSQYLTLVVRSSDRVPDSGPVPNGLRSCVRIFPDPVSTICRILCQICLNTLLLCVRPNWILAQASSGDVPNAPCGSRTRLVRILSLACWDIVPSSWNPVSEILGSYTRLVWILSLAFMVAHYHSWHPVPSVSDLARAAILCHTCSTCVPGVFGSSASVCSDPVSNAWGSYGIVKLVRMLCQDFFGSCARLIRILCQGM